MDPNDPNENDRDNEEAEVEHCVNNNIENEEHKCDICLIVKKSKETLRYHKRTHDDREKACHSGQTRHSGTT